jgi:hypothetical protein
MTNEVAENKEISSNVSNRKHQTPPAFKQKAEL